MLSQRTFSILSLLLLLIIGGARADDQRPNFVFITCEDISPNLGCYGDPDAITPNLYRFAAQGARFTRAFSHAPVCAPSRSGIITGMYPTTLGSHHMRSKLTRRRRCWSTICGRLAMPFAGPPLAASARPILTSTFPRTGLT